MQDKLKNELISFINEHNIDEIRNEDFTVNFEIVTESPDSRKDNFRTPLICALIRKDKYKLFKDLMREAESAQINFFAEDSLGQNALEYAISKENKGIISLLVEKAPNLSCSSLYYHNGYELPDDPMSGKWSVPDNVVIGNVISNNNWDLITDEGAKEHLMEIME